MTFLFCLFLWIDVALSSLSWYPSTALPKAITGGLAGSNHDASSIYLFDIQSSKPSVYQYDQQNYTSLGIFNYTQNPITLWFTSLQDVILLGYTGQSKNNLYIVAYTLSSHQFQTDPLATYPTPCPLGTSANITHLFILVACNLKPLELIVYNIATNKWNNNVSSPHWYAPMDRIPCISFNYDFYAFGCFSKDRSPSSICNWELDYRMIMKINSHYTWTVISTNLTYSAHFGSVIMPKNDGMIYIIGGQDHDTIYGNVNLFDAKTQKITDLTALPEPRKHFMIGSINEYIHIMGGGLNINQTNGTQTAIVSNHILTASPTVSPTASPTISPSHHDHVEFITKQEWIFIACSIGLFFFCCCVGIKIYRRMKASNSKHRDRRESSFDGIGEIMNGK